MPITSQLSAIALTILLLAGTPFGAFARTTEEMRQEEKRQAAIKSATALYATYIQQFPFLNEAKDFGKATRDRVFRSAAVLPVNAGNILYNPMNGITFVLVDTGTKTKVLKGLTPSELFSVTGQPPLKAEEQHIAVTFARVPEAIDKLRTAIADMRGDQVLDYLAKVDGSKSPYPDEAQDLISGPYIRASRYAECLNQIDGSKWKRKLQTDLLNAGPGGQEFLKAGFDYVDFVPVSAKEGLYIQVSKLGLFYVMSSVDMTDKCTITQSWYKTI